MYIHDGLVRNKHWIGAQLTINDYLDSERFPRVARFINACDNGNPNMDQWLQPP